MTYLEAVNRYLDLIRQPRITTFTGAADPVTQAKWLVNEAMRDVFYAYDWPWRKRHDVLQTVAPYETGTVSVTNASATVTGSGTTFTAAMVGRKFRVDGDTTYYQISAYVSATQITLADAYSGTTASGSDYSIYKDVYTLVPQTSLMLDRIAGIQLLEAPCEIIFASEQEYLESEPNTTTTGQPEVIVIYDRNTIDDPGSAATLWRAQFYPVPDAVYNLAFQYFYDPTEMSAATDDFDTASGIPPKMQQLIVWRAYLLGLSTGMEDDEMKSRVVEARYNVMLQRMINSCEPDKGRVRVMRPYEQPTRRRWLRMGPHYPDLG